MWSAKARTCRPIPKACGSSSMPKSCMVRAKRPMPAALRFPVSKWHRTACGSPGQAGSRQALEPHHEEHSFNLRGMRRTVRNPGQLCQRSQHRRLPEGRGCHDGSGTRLISVRFSATNYTIFHEHLLICSQDSCNSWLCFHTCD